MLGQPDCAVEHIYFAKETPYEGDVMDTIDLVSREMLKKAFSLAEESLSGKKNRFITEVITNEVSIVAQEGLVNAIIARALHDEFPSLDVKIEYSGNKGKKRIDIGLIDKEKKLVIAVEGKMMVSNSTKCAIKNSIDVYGIKDKLKGVKKDIADIGEKIRQGKVAPHCYEIFVPIVSEFYRTGSQSEWTQNRKPWATLPKFKCVREGLAKDFEQWFKEEDNSIELIHATEPIELRDANKMWLEQSQWMYPKYKSLEAYVSFFAFGRFVKA